MAEGPCEIYEDNKNEERPSPWQSHRPTSRKVQTKRPPVTKVVSVKKRSLNEQGYKDLEHWLANPNNVYIGRDMTHYVPGAVGSKWHNPFKEKEYHRLDDRLDMYKERIETDPQKYDGKTLLESLDELRGKTLGCWCKPDPCHGDVIVQLLKSKTMAECPRPETSTNTVEQRLHESQGTTSETTHTERPPVTKLVSVRKRSLNHQGYKDLEHWLTNPNNVYIGRDMTHYVPGAVGSKWQNPFQVNKYGRDKCIDMYKEYIQTDTKKYDGKTLLESLDELRGKTLGCWCSPDPCHGDVIIQLLKSKTMAECPPETSTNTEGQRLHESLGTTSDTVHTKRPSVTKVVSVRKRSLNHQGYKDLEHWLTNPNNVYIGRDMTHYVPGAVGSKWQNPFQVKKYGRDKCIDMYKEHIQTYPRKYDGKTLLESLDELRGKTLGCWCSPDPCHGDIIIQLLKSKN